MPYTIREPKAKKPRKPRETRKSITDAAKRPRKQGAVRRPTIKFEWKSEAGPGKPWNFVRERLAPPSKCAKMSYRTLHHGNVKNIPPGVRVLSCCPKGSSRGPDGRCYKKAKKVKGKKGAKRPKIRVPGFTQAVLHHTDRFAIRHPEIWGVLLNKRPGKDGVTTVTVPRPKQVDFEGFSGAGFAGFAGGIEFKNTGEAQAYLAKLQVMRTFSASANRKEEVRSLDHTIHEIQLALAQHYSKSGEPATLPELNWTKKPAKKKGVPKRDRPLRGMEHSGAAGPGLRDWDFKTGRAIMAYLSMQAGKGYKVPKHEPTQLEGAMLGLVAGLATR